MNKENIDELIALKLVGEISPADELIFQEWLASSGENKAHFAEMQKIWDTGFEDEQFEPNVEMAWNNVSKELGLEEKKRVGKIVQMPSRTNQLLYRIAATVVILLGVTWIYTSKFSEPEMIKFSSLANEQKEIVLPDESVVYLNANSTIEYPEKFKGDTREITLEGEAFFEIKKNPAKPFIIHTATAYTKVLGTSFNIRARKNTEEIVVSVKTGKVEVGLDTEHKVQLEPGYSAKVNLTKKDVEKVVTPSENYLSWKTREIIFSDVTIAEVIDFMESFYDVKVKANDEILDCHFTGKFNNPSLTEILNVLELSNGIQYSIKEKEISLQGNPCVN
jgi:transmembrane sensor